MINSKSTMSIPSNGNNTPIWKALGYASYQDYINATSGANGNKGVLSPWQGSQAPVSLYDGLKTPSVKMPSLDKYVSFIGGGTGGSTGGVTKEGVVIGNPNVNNSTFNNISAPKAASDTTAKKTVTTPSMPTPTTPTTPAQEETTPPPVARTDEGSYNGTSSFLEWYKENYGVDYDPSVGFSRREGMNDGVWNVGTNLYNYYLQGLDDEQRKTSEEENRNKYYDEQLETLLGEYSASREALDKSKRQSQQNASITLDKLKKYLPTQIKAQGLGGLGVSESTMLQAYNNYNNDMGAIESDYQANKTSLDTGETAAKNTLENYRQDALQKISDKYNAAADARQAEAGQTSNGIFSAYETRVREQMRQAFEDAYSTISNNTSTAVNEIMNYVQQFKGKISDSDYQTLAQYANTVAQRNLQTKQTEERAALYKEVANSLVTMAEGMLGDDGKMSSEDYGKLSEYINKYADKIGENVSNLQAILDGYQNYVRTAKEEQEIANNKDFYSIKQSDVKFNNNGGWWIFGSTDFSDGDNFSVIDNGGFKYRIQSGGEVADSSIRDAASQLGDNQVFGYAGQIYYKTGGKIYLIEKRDNSYADHYDKLYKKFFG